MKPAIESMEAIPNYPRRSKTSAEVARNLACEKVWGQEERFCRLQRLSSPGVRGKRPAGPTFQVISIIL
jgi:hypothetical protein